MKPIKSNPDGADNLFRTFGMLSGPVVMKLSLLSGHSYGNTFKVGLTLTNVGMWGASNYGYTWKLY